MPRERATWAEGEKAAIGTAIGEQSRVWFTLARGRLTEVFFPNPDRACTRSLGFLVAGDGFVSAEEDDATHAYAWPYEDVPLVSVRSRDRAGRYQLDTETVADPRSSVVLQRVRWQGPPGARLYVDLEPHVDNCGDDNDAAVIVHRGITFLTASHGPTALAVICSRPWVRCSAGVIGESDGRSDLQLHGTLTRSRSTAHGHVALIGELAVDEQDELVLALAFAQTPHEAAHVALGALVRGYEPIRDQFVAEWQAWCGQTPARDHELWTRSIVVLKTLEAKHVDGGRVAALATPWGPWRGPGLDRTYHVAWTRDLVETMGGLIAAGIHEEARSTLAFLRATQHRDGHWPQNMLLDGERVWRGRELDEAALPILLVDLLRREQALSDAALAGAWPMIERAASYIAATGPSTELDRWEDTPGVTPFTLAAEIAALACGARLGHALGHTRVADALLAAARTLDARVEALLYRDGGPLAARVGVTGYYVRARMPGQPLPALDLDHLPRTEVSPDALALVRFGVRRADDPRVVNTVRVIDAVLATELPWGTAYRRYPQDEYGEHADGAPFDGHGTGRPWPLLVGERAHYELARGDRARALELLHAMEQAASDTGMLPEQVWDGADLPARGLLRGRPTGSAAPLGWAHAEYLKLCRSLADGRVFDLPVLQLA